VQYARQAGVTGATVERQIRDLTYGDWVKNSTDQASKDGVTGTPTVLVGGVELSDLTPDGLIAAVDAARTG
jgi:2-hydroxychromene-2-carboxylate isomerase